MGIGDDMEMKWERGMSAVGFRLVVSVMACPMRNGMGNLHDVLYVC